MENNAVSQRDFLKRRLAHAKEAFTNKVNKTGKKPMVYHSTDQVEEVGSHPVEQQFSQHLQNSSCGVTKFSGKCVEDLLFVEIFAGTARLSKVARDTGFQALPIDKTTARASQIFIAQYDLTEPESLQAIIDILTTEKDRILAVHLAPACGTASRAREKKLTSFAKRGFKIPGPLRSQKQPMGIDGLSGLDKVRTETANLVYAATAKLIEVCHNLQILCSVENPENSLFWFFPAIAAIIETIGGHSVSFHNCMHGGGYETSLQNGGPQTRPSKPSEFFVTIAMVMPNGTQCQWGKICSSPRPRKQHILTPAL